MVLSKKTICILSVVMVTGTVLQFIAYVTPGWVVFVYTNWMTYSFFHENLRANYTYGWGMWYYYVCSPVRFEPCEWKTYHDEYYKFVKDEERYKDQKLFWQHGQMYERMILEEMWILVAFVCSCASCVTSSLCVKMKHRNRFLSFWTVILTSISESSVLPMIAVHIHQERWMTNDPAKSYRHLFPYSLLLCGMGLILRSASSIFHSVNIFSTSENLFDFSIFKDTNSVIQPQESTTNV